MERKNESTYEALNGYGKKVINNGMNAGEVAQIMN